MDLCASYMDKLTRDTGGKRAFTVEVSNDVLYRVTQETPGVELRCHVPKRCNSYTGQAEIVGAGNNPMQS